MATSVLVNLCKIKKMYIVVEMKKNKYQGCWFKIW